MLKSEDWQREQPIFWEHEGNAAVRIGQFKLVRQHGQDWELYDMESDRTELLNLAARNSSIKHDMARQYQRWADNSGVMDWEQALPKLLAA